MSTQPRAEHSDRTLALPPRQFLWYVRFWHVVYLGTLAVLLGGILLGAPASLGWREAALAALVLAQAGLYWRLVMRARHWPLKTQETLLYFGGSLCLWFLQWRLEPNFFWVVMMFFGQMYGLLPPKAAIPGTALIFALYFGQTLDWNLAAAAPGPAFGVLMGWLGSTVLYLFLFYAGRTSEERGQLIVQLEAAQEELKAARQRDAELAALRERERLARDLHDSLGHVLVALSVQLEAIQRLYRVDAEAASAQVDELKTLTRETMDGLRRSLAGLRTPGLGGQTLAQALQALAVQASQRSGLSVDSRIAPEADALPPQAAEVLWRVSQEALTNIEKHAGARQVRLALDVQPQAALLTISDDGVGLPADAEGQAGHFGLRGMRERVEGLGGQLTLAGSGPGAVVEVRLPRYANANEQG